MFKMFLCFILLVMGDIVQSKPDYIYNERAGGWMKLHMIAATWQDAFMKCHYEGAVLASPLDENLAVALHKVVADSILSSNIHLGTYSMFDDKNFVSVEGVPIENMYIKWGSTHRIGYGGDCLTMAYLGLNMYSMITVPCSETYPYICYKKRNDDEKINECGTFDKKYHLNRETGSCYKLHTETKPWFRAYEICTDEGGHLVIINDETEAEIIKGIFLNQTESRFTASHPKKLMHVGVRRWGLYDAWLTIHGEPMEDVYNEWSAENVTVYNDPRQNMCGFISKEGTLYKNECGLLATFICEKDPKTIRFDNISIST